MQKAYSANKIFNGENWLDDHAVIINEGLIESIVSTSQLPPGIEHRKFPDHFFAPAFIDVQVYGAAEKLLSAYPDVATLQAMQQQFEKEGTLLFQPTVATNTIDVFKECIDAVRDYWKTNGKGILGLHLEGPWLNEVKRGAHIKECIHSPSLREVKDLLEYGKGVVTMITLAPEVCSSEVIELILKHNIVIAAGHSNATYLQAIQSFDSGIKAVTHLYNAMSSLHHREPGLVGASLQHSKVMASVIPDGHHVDYAAIAIAKKLMGPRLFAITDAVTETDEGPYQHHLVGDKYESNGILSGSALSMHQAFYNLVHHVGIEVGEALRMCSLYPAQVLNVHHKYGRIAPDYTGQFLVLDKQLKLADVII
ncbi:MAG: N-acetylglucosamine-6-phosphate deacetylase [Flavisolibacter sp.]|jgi:N-acetylglucosamine-6-phosphate deacetylase